MSLFIAAMAGLISQQMLSPRHVTVTVSYPRKGRSS